jgi:hypothetical protein
VQFVEFLERHVPVERSAEVLPSISALVTRHHVEPDAAFHMSRPLFAFRIRERIAQLGDQVLFT